MVSSLIRASFHLIQSMSKDQTSQYDGRLMKSRSGTEIRRRGIDVLLLL